MIFAQCFSPSNPTVTLVLPIAAVHLISNFISMGFHALKRYRGLQG